jgi:hypothetical protein
VDRATKLLLSATVMGLCANAGVSILTPALAQNAVHPDLRLEQPSQEAFFAVFSPFRACMYHVGFVSISRERSPQEVHDAIIKDSQKEIDILRPPIADGFISQFISEYTETLYRHRKQFRRR